MKRIALALLLSSACVNHVMAEDVPAVLTVNGALTKNTGECGVTLNKSAVALGNHDMNHIPSATTNPLPVNNYTSPAVLIHASVAGDGCNFRYDTDNNYKFMEMRITGAATSNDNTVLVNTLTGEQAALGYGVGVYDYDGKKLALNNNFRFGNQNVYFYMSMVALPNMGKKAGNVQAMATVSIERL